MDSTLLSIPTVLPLVLGDRAGGARAGPAAAGVGHRRGSLLDVSSLQLWLGYTQYRRGDLEAAEDLLRRANEGFAVYGLGQRAARVLRRVPHRGPDRPGRRRGRPRRAREQQRPGRRVERLPLLRARRMRLLAAEGRWEDVLRETAAFEARFRHYRDAPDSPWRVLRADALDRLERTGEAIDARRRRSSRRARQWGAPGTVGPRAHAARPAGAGGGDRAPRGGRRPARRLDREARARPRAARPRRPRSATPGARRTRATRCGARWSSPRSAARRRWRRPRGPSSTPRARGRAPRRSPGVEALTASEKRVADLAASGDTNRDIAQALYVTPKTVEVHLSNAYRKLGIRSRRELAGALGVAS